MILSFAYDSSMHRAAIEARCPRTIAIGVARPDGDRFFIGARSVARWSISRWTGSRVIGRGDLK